jgi:hypothetical protein
MVAFRAKLCHLIQDKCSLESYHRETITHAVAACNNGGPHFKGFRDPSCSLADVQSARCLLGSYFQNQNGYLFP